MKCPICGAEIAEGSKFCEYCGSPLSAPAAPTPEAAPVRAAAPAPAPQQAQPQAQQAQPQYQQPQAQQAQPQYQQPQAAYQQPRAAYQQPAAAQPASNKLNVWALVLGISSMGGAFTFVWVMFLGLIAIGIGIAGLVVSKKAKAQNPTNKMARTGFTLSLIGLIIAIILTIIITIVQLVAVNRYRYYW